ncbi:MAG: penicillin-binding transpeptidase domain-containing protein [Aggregatilineales bacterium]
MRSSFVLCAVAGCLTLLLGACGGVSPPEMGGGSAPIIAAAQTPQDTVRAFLNAWGARDYEAMYAQLSSESQGLYAFPVFRATYEEADARIGTNGVQFNILTTQQQGRTAAVSYDATINSSIFGSIEDPGRMMRLVQTPNGWRVAWTSMDIFEGLAAGARIEAATRRLPRGNIYDRNGEVLVEQGGTVVELYAMRNEINDVEACITLLAGIVHRQRHDLVRLFQTYAPETIFPIGDVDPDVFARRENDLRSTCSIRTNTRETRRYVGHGSAVHVTGYIGQIPLEQVELYESRGYQSGELVGRTGIEFQLQDELAGESSSVLRITEPGGLLIRELAGREGAAPQDVTLTLDRNLQLAAAQALADAYIYARGNWASTEHSTGAGVVVLDVNTGAVLALASYPMFDPGIFNPDTPLFQVGEYITRLGNDPRQPFFNRVVQNSYAPGSTFKVVTTAAAAGERIWPRDELFYCSRIWQGRQFGDSREERYDWRLFEPEPFNFETGEVTMAEALTASCNPFFYQMGAQLFNLRGPAVLTEYARRMGLGGLTGFDLTSPPEVAGRIDQPNGVDAAISIAIGQGNTQVTVLQMARMTAGIANGGTLYRPYVIERIGREGEPLTFQAQPQVMGTMGLSDEVLAIVREGMCAVTDSTIYGRTSGERLGTAWFVFSDPDWYPAPYTVCAKTGTAQTGRPEPHGWLIAYAPADDPQVAIAALVEHSREGSETAAPIIRRILDAYFGVEAAPYPRWWFENEYVPLTTPDGYTGA